MNCLKLKPIFSKASQREWHEPFDIPTWISCFSIYIGQPVSPQFGQMARKIQDWSILSRNRLYYFYRSVQITEKRPQKPETGIKYGF